MPRPHYPTKAAWAAAQADQLWQEAVALPVAGAGAGWREMRRRDERHAYLLAESIRFRYMASRLKARGE